MAPGDSMECSNCGATVDINKLFCPECKAPMHLSDAIMPVREDGPPPARKEDKEKPEPDQGEIHRQTVKAWVIRILIMVLMVGILVVALIILANSGKSPAATGVRPQLLTPIIAECQEPRELRTGYIQDSNIPSGASGRSSGETPLPVCATSHLPSGILRR